MKSLRSACVFALATVGAPAAAQPIAWHGADWRVEDIGGQSVIDNAQTTLSAAPDGKAPGSTGCNRYFKKATRDGARIRIWSLATTRRACPRALVGQERKFLSALLETRSARFDVYGRMQRLSARGEPLLTLTRM